MTSSTTGEVAGRTVEIVEKGKAAQGTREDEVVLGLSPAFSGFFTQTICGVAHVEVLRQVMAGAEEQGVSLRVIRAKGTNDLAKIAHAAARLSGSGIGIGVLSRGTSMIHQKDLPKLSSMELFPQAPLLVPETFRAIGSNAAQYAKGESPAPVPVQNDFMARPRYQAKAALLHLRETEFLEAGGGFVELEVTISRAKAG
ncbi:MAG: propanediol/glycerol family dehydratase medium subunit [Pseudonocardia sp.]|nr:propanediol/glycerol family dehydratase medium subunit [Pseudonocardia sp.]